MLTTILGTNRSVIFLLVSVSFVVSVSSLDRYKRNDGNSYDEPTKSEMDRLSKLYGRETVEARRNDFIQVGELGQRQQPIFHPRPAPLDARDFREYRQNEIRAQAQQLQNQPLTPSIVKSLLRELLQRLDTLDMPERNADDTGAGRPTPGEGRCSLHGLWISAITGVAFQLEPSHSAGSHSNVLHVQVVDVGKSPETQFVTSEWAGTAQVSTESPTTISIILQEKMTNPEVEPKTAVFVGQCVVCNTSPTIQGTWVLFPKNQICFQEANPPTSDVMYLLTA